MFVLIAAICIGFAYIVTYGITPWLIKYLRRIDVVVQDVHKEKKPLVPISGGIAVVIGVMAGLMLFVFFRTFLPFKSLASSFSEQTVNTILIAVLTIYTITFIGFIDDLLIRKSKSSSAGLKQWQKPLLTLTAAIPLMVSQSGTTEMIVPFVGHVNFGVLYPLLLVPIGVVGAANMVNILAGFNGMESGMGAIYLFSLGLYGYVHERYAAALIALVTCASLIALYRYNRVPAKILPGDSLTYLLGATIAVVAITGNLEKAAVIVSMPFIIEFFLKLRGKFQKVSIGYVKKDGKVQSQYKEIYSIPHILTRTGKYTEKQVVYTMIGIQTIFAALIWIV